MALTSPRFAPIQQCRDAANNSPAMKSGHKGPGVAAVQQALIDLGYPMPISTKRFGVPDGIYGTETTGKVKEYQGKKSLTQDGIVGKDVMARLDNELPTPHSAPTGLPYYVPGFKVALAQPTSLICWATVHCMMRSWKKQQSFGIRPAAAAVDEKYGVMVDQNKALPSTEFGPFIQAANMALQPMMNLTIAGWLGLLRSKGLLWVGTLNSLGPDAGLHSRIVEAMSGDGQVDGTMMHIIDPAGGRLYQETFRDFLAKYEGAFMKVTGDYFQIRHFK